MRALIKEGLDVLQVGPGERELESVFLELATPDRLEGEAEKANPRRAKRKAAEKKAAARDENEEGGES